MANTGLKTYLGSYNIFTSLFKKINKPTPFFNDKFPYVLRFESDTIMDKLICQGSTWQCKD